MVALASFHMVIAPLVKQAPMQHIVAEKAENANPATKSEKESVKGSEMQKESEIRAESETKNESETKKESEIKKDREIMRESKRGTEREATATATEVIGIEPVIR